MISDFQRGSLDGFCPSFVSCVLQDQQEPNDAVREDSVEGFLFGALPALRKTIYELQSAVVFSLRPLKGFVRRAHAFAGELVLFHGYERILSKIVDGFSK